MVALTLVVLMIFAAFAVDLGAVYGERRQDQNAADAAAMSAAVQFLTVQTPQAGASEAAARVSKALDTPISNDAWQSCTDPGALPRTARALGLTPSTDCISFSSGFDRIRVRTPDQRVPTSFGRVVGIDEFTAAASAEAGLQAPGGGALPFVVLAMNGPGDQICLRTDGRGGNEPPDHPPVPPYVMENALDPCNGLAYDRASGARGTTLPYRYVGDCKAGPGNQTIVDAIIRGMDHALGVYQPPVHLLPGQNANSLDNPSLGYRPDGGSNCTVPLPNALEVDTGLSAKNLQCGLVLSSCSSGTSATKNMPGRLYRAGSGASFNGYPIDDVALWEYFVSPLPASAPMSCTAAATPGNFYTRRAALANCLQTWTTGVLFAESIAESPRIGFVPKVAELGLCRDQPQPDQSCSGPAPDHVHINGFEPVFIDGIYERGAANCDLSNPATASGTAFAIHYPGKGLDCGNTGGGSEVSRLSAMIIPCGALPQSVCDSSASPDYPGTSAIMRVRLLK